MGRVSRGDALARLRQALEDYGCTVRGTSAQCPGPDHKNGDRTPSLSIDQGREGVIVKCQLGCSTDMILEMLGMSRADLFDEPRGEHGGDDWTPAGPAVATYLYTDPAGKTLFGVCRTADKRFSQWRPDPAKPHGRAWSVKDIRAKLVPYRLPRILAAVDAGETVYIAEGEKDVHAIEAAGVTATCNPMGAGKWRPAYSRHLAGAAVVIIADRDERGIAHARDVAAKLDGIAASVTIVTAAEGKDAADHLAAGHGIGDFIPLAAENDASHPSAVSAHLHTPPALASDQDILRRAVGTLRVCRGLVGENRAAKLLYLAFTSRLLAEPVNAVVKGLSSSGKSYTIECVAALFPAEAVYTMTAMSERALIYLDEPLTHRTLILYEAAALREGREKAEDNQTAYIVRSLLSEGRIEYPVVIRGDDGQFRTETKVIPGPTNLITSTTSISLHGENETRMLSVPSNDSKAQTRAVMLQSSGERKRADADFTEWHDLQRWLAGQESAGVVIPYAACVAAQIPPVAVRLRRDWNAVRSLIRAHALLHQVNRKRDEHGRIMADLYDYTAVRSLVNDLIADAVGAAVPESVRETVELVQAQTVKLGDGDEPPDPDGIKVAKIASLLKLERSAATRRLHSARDRGYLVNLEDRRGKPARYVLGDPLPGEVVVLPPAEAICTPPCTHLAQGEPAGQECDCTGVCRCADDAEG